MKVVVYVRVSTGKQVEEGLGLVDQEHACRTWARQHGHQVLAVFRDQGISGTKELEHRLGLAEALAAVKDGRAGAIVVYRLDRLARDLILQSSCWPRSGGPGSCCRPPVGRPTSMTIPRTRPGG